MMDIFGTAFSLFGWFFWLLLFVVFVWFIFKLLERLRTNDLNKAYNSSSEDVTKIIKGERERNNTEERNK